MTLPRGRTQARRTMQTSFLRSLASRWKPALVGTFREGYGPARLGKDLASGLTVGVIALPLAMAFAIGAGATPAQGLWTAIVAGGLIAALGGSKYQVSGPTGAFVVIIADVIARHGMSGLIVATFLAGLILVAMGVTGVGKLVKYIPYPVTTGFTTGIGVVIAVGQLRDFFGLRVPEPGSEVFERLAQAVEYAPSFSPVSLALGAATLAGIVLVRKLAPRVPAAVLAIATVTAAAFFLKLDAPTVGSVYGELPRGFPAFGLPAVSWSLVREVLPSALTIALLGSIESLLSAVVADGMKGDRHDSDTELVAQGLGNVASALLGGIPATGAIARTAANIKNGATSPVSALVHAAVLLAFTLLLAPVASAIPLASLAAVLLMVAWDMSELERFIGMRRAPRSDFLVMLLTFALTVAVDLTVAVQFGLLLAVLLFVKRVNETFGIAPLGEEKDAPDDPDATSKKAVPKGIEIFEVRGPFFFGTADRLQDALGEVSKEPHAFILRMRRVPSIDATGLNALGSFLRHCRRHGTALVLSGVREQPRKAMERAGFIAELGQDNVFDHIDGALERARALVAERETASAHGARAGRNADHGGA